MKNEVEKGNSMAKKWTVSQRSKFIATMRRKRQAQSEAKRVIEAEPIQATERKLSASESFLNDCWNSLDVERKARALASLLKIESGSLTWR